MENIKFSVKTAGRTIKLLELFIKSSKPLTFIEIQNALDIPKSSLHYLIQDLVNYDYLAYDKKINRYLKGMRLVQYATICVNNTNVIDEINLVLGEIAKKFGESVHAGVLDSRFVTYIAKINESNEISLSSEIGLRVPAHSTAMGKVLLSQLDDEEVLERLNGVELEKITPFTVTNKNKLLSDLDKIRKMGYAVENQESILHAACVAIPVYDNTNNKIALAISVTIPIYRKNDEYIEKLVGELFRVSKNLSIKIGNV